MNEFLSFWTFSDPTVRWVVLGALCLGFSAGLLGCFAFLRKQALLGDALAHAALPGVTTAFLLTYSRSPFIILTGAAVSCFLGIWSIEYLVRHTKIKEDSALAIVLSLFFALGIFQLTYIQKLGVASQAGLDRLLFGQAASLVRSDVIALTWVSLALMICIGTFFYRFKLVCFDRQLAISIGIRVKLYDALLAVALVLSIAIGLQLVGVVLMAAILVTPAAAARYWSNSLTKILLLAGVFGALSGIMGAYVSYLAPRMPTGPWIVVAVTAIFVASLLFAPERGVLSRVLKRAKLRVRINEENLLRTFYKLREEGIGAEVFVEPRQILEHRNMHIRDLESGLSRLVQDKDLVSYAGKYRLTKTGLERATRLTRIHRLWEVYLSQKIQISADHVHEDAEEIEHIITPELEQRLLEELNFPREDPHGRAIPSLEEK